MLSLFAQATKDALSLVGEASFLRGTVPCQVNIEHGVQFAGMDTEFETARDTRNSLFVRSVATIETTHAPKPGDTLAHPDGNFILDTKIEDSGAFQRFVLVKA